MAAAVAQALLQGASSPAACLVGTTIAAPLILPSPAAAAADYLAVVLSAEVAVADGTCRLTSGSTTHVSTHIAPALGGAPAEAGVVAAVEQLAVQCSEPLATEYAYRQLATAGLQYGPSFRQLRSIKRGHGSAAAKVHQPAAQLPAEFLLNPAVLDCCLQLGGMVPAQQQAAGAAAGSSGGQQATFIPASLAALYLGAGIGSSSTGAVTALAQRPSGATDTAAAIVRNHAIVGATGSVVCQLNQLESKSTSNRSAAAAAAGSAGARQDILYEITWAAADPLATNAQLLQPATSSSLLGLAATGSSVQLAATSMAAVQGALSGVAAGLQLQTRGQHAALVAPAGAAGSDMADQLWGLLRTTAAECQSLAVSGADRDSMASATDRAPANSAQLLLLGSQATEPFDGYGSAAASGSRFLPLMQPSAARSVPAAFQLFPQPRGALQNLAPLPLDSSAALAPGQVLVAIKAVGINFRWGRGGVGGGCGVWA